jgi:hypothetical protein
MHFEKELSVALRDDAAPAVAELRPQIGRQGIFVDFGFTNETLLSACKLSHDHGCTPRGALRVQCGEKVEAHAGL